MEKPLLISVTRFTNRTSDTQLTFNRVSGSKTSLKWLDKQADYLNAGCVSYGLSNDEKEWRSAIIINNYQDISCLLKKNNKLANWKDYISGNTALHFAAKANDTALILLLAGDYKAHVDAQNNGGLTPLHFAAIGGSKDAAFLLMSRFNAKAFIRDYSGRLPSKYLPPTPNGESMKSSLRGQMSKLLEQHPELDYLLNKPVDPSAKMSTVDPVLNEVDKPHDKESSKESNKHLGGFWAYNLISCGGVLNSKKEKSNTETGIENSTPLAQCLRKSIRKKLSSRSFTRRKETKMNEKIENYNKDDEQWKDRCPESENEYANFIYSSIRRRKQNQAPNFNPLPGFNQQTPETASSRSVKKRTPSKVASESNSDSGSCTPTNHNGTPTPN